MARRFEVAVIGANAPIGESLLELLSERRLPIGELSALILNAADGEFLSAAGQELPVENAETFDFGQVQMAFLAGNGEAYAAEAERAAESGCVVVDASGHAWEDPAIPVVVPELNADALAGFNERGIVANPASLTVALALVLGPLHRIAGLRQLTLTGLLAASEGGRAALEDLVRETTALLSAQFYERRHFPRQIAFNVHGQSGDAEGDGYTVLETRIGQELRRLLDIPGLQVSASLVQAPLFYGHAAAVDAAFDRALSVDAASIALRAAPSVELIESPLAADCPSPVTDAALIDVVRVARLRASLAAAQGLALWMTADNIRRCAALNALGNAEILIRDYL